MKRLAAITIVFFALTSLWARPVRTASYLYYQDVTVKAANKAQYGILPLPQEVLANSHGRDLRLVLEGEAVPHFRRRSTIRSVAGGSKAVKVLFSKKQKAAITYVVQLPEISKDQQYNAIKVSSDRFYEATVNLSSSNKPRDWQSMGERFIYRYKGSDESSISIEPGKHRYLRLRFNQPGPFKIGRATYTPVKQQVEVAVPVGENDIKTKNDSDRRATLIRFANERRYAIHRVALTFKDSQYNRRIEIDSFAVNKEFINEFSGTLRRRGAEKGRHLIDLPNPLRGAIRIAVTYGDDKPLTLEKVELFSPKEELVFALPEASEGLRLYYGNEYANAAEYDIRDTYSIESKHTRASSGEQQKNADFGYSMVEPPVSTYIIRAIFILGLFGLLWPSYKAIQKFAQVENES